MESRGLTRNPAGYSRGMQFVLKGLHDRHDLGPMAKDSGCATSWLDDICMRATTFEAFCELFETVLVRLVAASMTLKGEKCELLHEFVDVLGFRATPHGLMIQKPKLEAILDKGIPQNTKAAGTFLGGVAFLRRMVPRISLLTAPITRAIKAVEKRNTSLKGKSRRQRAEHEITGKFTPDEQKDVDQAWYAVLHHLDNDTVLAAPDFSDPLAHFVICTDASDYAVGGVLMQWQHEDPRGGPGPPADHPGEGKGSDPLSSKWRREQGWKLKVVSYYSKTLDSAQRNYPAFDKEAGAILLCVRQWAELITYHPTTVYTDSAVATSMLTKHVAPPRLQRWGVELGSYLPHLKISYRKGADNGLADLLSRFPVFTEFTNQRSEVVTLPDDLFDHIGDIPLFKRTPSVRLRGGRADVAPPKYDPREMDDRDYLSRGKFELYEPKRPLTTPDTYWCAGDAPEIPGRGLKDRVGTTHDAGDVEPNIDSAVVEPTETYSAMMLCADASVEAERSCGYRLLEALVDEIAREGEERVTAAMGGHNWQSYEDMFRSTCWRTPYVQVCGFDAIPGALEEITSCVERIGGTVILEGPTDVAIVWEDATAPPGCPVITLGRGGGDAIPLRGRTVMVKTSFPVDVPTDRRLLGSLAPNTSLDAVLLQAVANWMYTNLGCPLPTASMCAHETAMREHWRLFGFGTVPTTLEPTTEVAETLSIHEVLGIEGIDADPPAASTAQRSRTRRRFDWQDVTPMRTLPDDDAEDPPPELDRSIPPTVVVTREEQLKDPQLRVIMEALDGEHVVARAYRERVSDKYELLDSGLHRVILKDGEAAYACVVPRHMRAAILSRLHYTLPEGGGHAGSRVMYEAARQSYYWRGMEQEVELFVSACERCGETRSQTPIGAPMAMAPTPQHPFQVIHVDHKGPLPMSGGYNHVLVAVCALTRFTIYIPVKSTKGKDTFEALVSHVFAYFGVPLVIVSDNGTAFANKLMKASEALFGYRQVFVLPHTPQANGLAEAAVKKLKLVFDRHTRDYHGWHLLCPAAMMTVNQRLTSSHRRTAFSSLFGRQAPSLTALEQPDLLPAASTDEQDVKELAFSLSRLHARLQKASDDVKQAAVDARAWQRAPPGRVVQAGDRVWLTYGDSERARYLRKHGHGRAWKHAFVVQEVKPHAVRLVVPKDGSVPDVQEWQSLRKCSFAAPHAHDESLTSPPVNELGLPCAEVLQPDLPAAPQVLDDILDDPMGWTDWTPEKVYEIEAITSAQRVGSGWRVWVRWRGYPDATPEPLSKIEKSLDSELAAQVEKCKAAYFDANPSERHVFVDDPPAEPTRVQPSRARKQTEHLIYMVNGVDRPILDTAALNGAYARLSESADVRLQALSYCRPDLSGLAYPVAGAA